MTYNLPNKKDFFELRDIVMRELQSLRDSGAIARFEEAGVELNFIRGFDDLEYHCKNLLLADNFKGTLFCGTTIFKTSLLRVTHNEKRGEPEFELRCYSLVGDTNYELCPRCRNYCLQSNNYDNLCDKCVTVLREAWYAGLYHEVPAIKAFAEHYGLRPEWIRKPY